MQQQIRITDPTSLDTNSIDKELKEGKHVIVQFSRNIYALEILTEINKLCQYYDKSFGVRFYGHDYTAFNCETLEALPDVKCLYVDCLFFADNLYVLGNLIQLQKLSLGVYELKDTEILKLNNLRKLTDLIITETKTKALNLEYLSEYSNLNFLIIGGHTKNINAVSYLQNLSYLSLNSIKKVDVSFINHLKNLKILKFILGGRENIQEIEENEIEDLDIIWVRGFNDFNNVSKFKNLRLLSIEDNIQFKKLDFDKEMKFLKFLRISNCKTFDTLTGLHNLTALERIGIYKTNIDFESFIQQDFPSSLKAMRFFTTKTKLDEKIKSKISQLGYTE